MPVFDDYTIERFELNGEQDFASFRQCIVERIGISLVAGTGTYTLPSYISDIRRITYLGWKVWPLPHRDLRQSYISGTQQSRPYWYIFNNIGQSKIQFFPVPSVDLVDSTTATSIWGDGILGNCIIEYFRQPDADEFQIPDFFRRRLLKRYVNKRCFAMEGKGNNLKNVKYWNSSYDLFKNLYSELLDDLNNKPRNLVCSDKAQNPYGYVPPPPMLPIDRFGPSVDDIW